ncbi:MAG: hypothetical protein H6825_11805 [Planctomycetes bacterium]|nr:hypothetical protein [Planctomycetota bacterium]
MMTKTPTMGSHRADGATRRWATGSCPAGGATRARARRRLGATQAARLVVLGAALCALGFDDADLYLDDAAVAALQARIEAAPTLADVARSDLPIVVVVLDRTLEDDFRAARDARPSDAGEIVFESSERLTFDRAWLPSDLRAIALRGTTRVGRLGDDDPAAWLDRLWTGRGVCDAGVGKQLDGPDAARWMLDHRLAPETVCALLAVGHLDEAVEFAEWFWHATLGTPLLAGLHGFMTRQMWEPCLEAGAPGAVETLDAFWTELLDAPTVNEGELVALAPLLDRTDEVARLVRDDRLGHLWGRHDELFDLLADDDTTLHEAARVAGDLAAYVGDRLRELGVQHTSDTITIAKKGESFPDQAEQTEAYYRDRIVELARRALRVSRAVDGDAAAWSLARECAARNANAASGVLQALAELDAPDDVRAGLARRALERYADALTDAGRVAADAALGEAR